MCRESTAIFEAWPKFGGLVAIWRGLCCPAWNLHYVYIRGVHGNGAHWDPMGPMGSPWGSHGSHGIPMGPMGIPWVPWDSHGNGSKISHGMGIGWEWELSAWEWELKDAGAGMVFYEYLLFLHSSME